jgi:dynactin-6
MASAARPSSKRPTPIGPKPPTSIDPSCVIAATSAIQGTHIVTLSANTVLHPRSNIMSTYGPVTLGEGCIICEKVTVGLLGSANGGKDHGDTSVVLGRNVTIEPMASVEATSVGDGTVIESGVKIGRGAVIGKVGCSLRAVITCWKLMVLISSVRLRRF